jgi:hypothetical protein
MQRKTWQALLAYAAFALATVGCGLLTFSHLSGLYPGPNLDNPPAAFTWYTEYGVYLRTSSCVLATVIGLTAAVNGRREGNPVKGLVILGGCWLLTALAYGVLPRHYPPHAGGDDFYAWLLFMAYGAYPAIGAWLIGNLVLWVSRRRAAD